MCERPLGQRTQWHHTVPKAKKGRETVPLHPICHRTIHVHFTNAELARIGSDREAILAPDSMQRFLQWIASKPSDFHAPTKRAH